MVNKEKSTSEKLRAIEKKLKAPFHENEIEWRVQKQGMTKNNDPYAMVLAYVQNRAIMDRLDKVVTPFGWQNDFVELSDGSMYCKIGLRVHDNWIWKGDGAGKTDIEATKGGFSDAMKRAGYQWGIGRYLYKLDVGWANFVEKGNHQYRTKIDKTYYYWNPPALPEWAKSNN